MGLSQRFPAYGGQGPGDLRLGLALGAITTVLIVLRVYVRLRINRLGTTALIWSLVTYAFTLLTQIFGILAGLHGLGNHLSVIEETGQLSDFLLFTWITIFFFNIAVPLGKVAVVAFLIEVDAHSHPKIRYILLTIAALNLILNFPQIFLVWFQCDPPQALWTPSLPQHCDHTVTVRYSYFLGALAALSDFVLAIIPSYILWPLAIDKRLKWGLSFLMGLGIVAGAAAIVRTWAAKLILSDDASYGLGTLFRWGQVEEWLVIICMSIPPIWPLFRQYFKRRAGASSSASHTRPRDRSRISSQHSDGELKLFVSRNSRVVSHLTPWRTSANDPDVDMDDHQIFRKDAGGAWEEARVASGS